VGPGRVQALTGRTQNSLHRAAPGATIPRMRPAILAALLTLASVLPASAVSLHQGDMVAIDTHWGPFYTRVVRLVPGSGLVEQIAIRGLLENASATDLAVLSDGRILVSTWMRGVVVVQPNDGAQSVYLTEAALGGKVSGLAVESGGTVLMLVHSAGEGRILRHDPADGSLEIVSSGSDLSDCGDIAISRHGGELFVSRAQSPTSGAAFGSIVRLSPQGAPLAVFTSDEFRGPSQLAVTGNGQVYASNGGSMAAGYSGRLTRTEIPTGITVSAAPGNECSGVAVIAPEQVFYSWKSTSQVGETWSVACLSPAGWSVSDVTGPIEVVTEEPVPARSASWGAVKRTYR